MKKFTAPVFTFFLAALVIFSSCNDKGGGVTPPPKTKTELITTGTWRFGSARWGGVDISSSPMIPSCAKDNIYKFMGGNAAELNEGPTVCNTGDPQIVPFTWNFQSGETILYSSIALYPGGSNNWNILTLTEVEITVSQSATFSGTTKPLEITFIH